MQPLEVAFGSSLMSDKVSGVQAGKIARNRLFFDHLPKSLGNLDAVASRLRAIEVKQLSGMPRSACAARMHFLTEIPRETLLAGALGLNGF